MLKFNHRALTSSGFECLPDNLRAELCTFPVAVFLTGVLGPALVGSDGLGDEPAVVLRPCARVGGQ